MEQLASSKKQLKLLAVLFVIAAALVQASWAGPDFRTIDTAELHEMVVDNAFTREGGREERFTIIDARTKQEYDQAHIFSAISVPENDFAGSSRVLPQNKDELLVVYCSGARECETSRKWANDAAAAGYRNVAIYKEGFQVWKDKKMPVASLEKGKQ